MEQQAFYIVFAIIGMAIVGIVSWAATFSSRNDYDDYYRHPGGYSLAHPAVCPCRWRGPDQPSNWFEVVAHDLSLRKCLETKADIFKANGA